MTFRRALILGATLAALAASAAGCSIKKMAARSLASALAEGSGVYATDDDPELVGDALPFGLKTMEAVLVQVPDHRGLRLAAASGFTQYAVAYVLYEADYVRDDDLDRSIALRARSKALFLRARDHGLRGLDTRLPDIAKRLRSDHEAALAGARRDDVPLLYWTAAAWGSAISVAKDDADLSADLAVVEAMARRALELDEGFDGGALHDFFVTYEAGRNAAGGSIDRARRHFARSVELSGGHRAFTFVGFAEAVSVATQNRAEFEEVLGRALAVDPGAEPDLRLSNILAQRRARWLLGRADELFVE